MRNPFIAMNKPIILLSVLVFIFCLAQTSCKRKDNVESIFTYLSHSWKVVKLATDDNGNNGIDASEIHAPANGQDNRFVFKTDNTGSETVIAANGVTTEYPFTWSLLGKDSVIRNGVGNNVVRYKINSISTTRLELRMTTEQSGILVAYYFERY